MRMWWRGDGMRKRERSSSAAKPTVERRKINFCEIERSRIDGAHKLCCQTHLVAFFLSYDAEA